MNLWPDIISKLFFKCAPLWCASLLSSRDANKSSHFFYFCLKLFWSITCDLTILANFLYSVHRFGAPPCFRPAMRTNLLLTFASNCERVTGWIIFTTLNHWTHYRLPKLSELIRIFCNNYVFKIGGQFSNFEVFVQLDLELRKCRSK